MSSILDKYKVFYNDKVIGYYYIYSNHKATYYTEWGCPWDMAGKRFLLCCGERYRHARLGNGRSLGICPADSPGRVP